MTDLEATRLCAEAMGIPHEIDNIRGVKHWGETVYRLDEKDETGYRVEYRPLHNDAQMAALVKRLMLTVDMFCMKVSAPPTFPQDVFVYFDEDDQTLNWAVVHCAAKMQAAKGEK